MKGRGSMNALCPLMMEKVRHKSGRRHIGHFAAKMGERAGGMVVEAEGGGVPFMTSGLGRGERSKQSCIEHRSKRGDLEEERRGGRRSS